MTDETGLTVEAWLEVGQVRAEAVQTAVAEWTFAEQMSGFTSYDAGDTDGLPTQGFFGAVYADGHVYYAPQCNNLGRHGNALRHSTSKSFHDAAAWEAFDAGSIGGLATRGYYGCLADDRYVYYVPRTDGENLHSRVLRFDRQASFASQDSWSAFDEGEPISSQGGAFDGRCLYFAPGYHKDTGPSGSILRHDTTAAFDEASSWARFDAAALIDDRCRCYDGAVYDGRYVYFVPLEGGNVLRFDTSGDFSDPRDWESFDRRSLHGADANGANVGAIFDGRYVYLTPYAHSTVVRYDTTTSFSDSSSWSTFDAASTSGLDCRGYDGAAFDGRFVYFIPFWRGGDAKDGFHAQLLRFDTLRSFDDPAAWLAADGAAAAPPNPGGFNGGAFDGRHLYMAPWRQDEPTGDIYAHGHVLRYDTAGTDARYQLRWMDCGHNGGLGGSLPGPAFVLNVGDVAVSLQAHVLPAAGRHHLAGVVRGNMAELWLDGTCVATRPLPGGVAPATARATIGELAGGASPLQGQVLQHRVSDTAMSHQWLQNAAILLDDEDALRGLAGSFAKAVQVNSPRPGRRLRRGQ
jgi:hypothetical protein